MKRLSLVLALILAGCKDEPWPDTFTIARTCTDGERIYEDGDGRLFVREYRAGNTHTVYFSRSTTVADACRGERPLPPEKPAP